MRDPVLNSTRAIHIKVYDGGSARRDRISETEDKVIEADEDSQECRTRNNLDISDILQHDDDRRKGCLGNETALLKSGPKELYVPRIERE